MSGDLSDHNPPAVDNPPLLDLMTSITLRDLFAGMAMQGLLACPETDDELCQEKNMAPLAYLYADAMLKEREA